MLAAHRAAIADLCRRHDVERLDVFGSAVTGEFDPSHSDVDLLVTFRPGATHLDNYLALAGALEDLIGRKVDLVIERAIRNPYFRRTIEQSRRLIYAHADEEAAV
jgi:predicted nucleotidyltransferase